MALLLLRLIFILSACTARVALAQEEGMDRPPPLDPASDFEEVDDDMAEDDGFRPPPPPPPGAGINMPAPSDFRPGGSGNAGFAGGAPPNYGGGGGSSFHNSATANKLKFKIVDGEFLEKGKKRGRGVKNVVPAGS